MQGVGIYYGPVVDKMALWRRVGFMEPLRDSNGDSFVSIDLPCYARPEWWDEDARDSDKQTAAKLCRGCPALVECAARRDQSVRGEATGVWAGVIMKMTTRSCGHSEETTCRCLMTSAGTG